jgi:hypothetical protein
MTQALTRESVAGDGRQGSPQRWCSSVNQPAGEGCLKQRKSRPVTEQGKIDIGSRNVLPVASARRSVAVGWGSCASTYRRVAEHRGQPGQGGAGRGVDGRVAHDLTILMRNRDEVEGKIMRIRTNTQARLRVSVVAIALLSGCTGGRDAGPGIGDSGAGREGTGSAATSASTSNGLNPGGSPTADHGAVGTGSNSATGTTSPSGGTGTGTTGSSPGTGATGSGAASGTGTSNSGSGNSATSTGPSGHSSK